jgi:DNA polymerase elongation subunit (family B)
MQILLLDIETAPHKVYCWGLYDQNISINQIVEPGFTLCWSAKWYGTKKIYFSSLQRDGHKKMIQNIYDLLEEANAIISYNGNRFDIPTLNKEFVLEGLTPPSSYKEIDLLRIARQRFRFPSNKLDYISKELGLGSKTKHLGMDLWRGCMSGEKASWRIMERYNKQDVKLLEALYIKLLPWIKNHPNHGLYVDAKHPICRNCGSPDIIKKGFEYLQVGKYQRYKCNTCGAPNRGATMLNSLDERRRLLR